ncbi:class I adenylate-forming enzyme family protein [Nocardia sp. NBC_01388]|uniref:class I adenylate-forming enzyme family protein n=1 Tax=Nocardia sp. NBC_01388 TaxID=2903596 RepID=UPI00324DD895
MVPVDIGLRPTIPEALRRAAREFGHVDYLVSMEERYTFADAERLSGWIARRMLAHGIGKGTRVGLFFTYGGEWLLTWLAASRIGAFVMPFSTFYSAAELRTALRIGDVDVLIAPDMVLNIDVAALLEEALPSLAGQSAESLRLSEAPFLRRVWTTRPVVREWATDFPLCSEPGPSDADRDLLAAAEEQVFPSDPAVAVYTSGSTAEPKGVVLTHGTVMRQSSIMAAHQQFWADGLPPKYLTTMPLFWVGGILAITGALHQPMTVLCLPRLEPGPALQLLERERGTAVIGFPTFVQRMRSHPDFTRRDLTSARMLLEGPADVSMINVPGEAPIHRGMSESGGSFLTTETVVVDPATGIEVPPGVAGELWIRGPGVMEGYLKKERWEVFDADGWYHTGDRVHRLVDASDNRVFFDGRYNELIKSAGANVSPQEVEAVLDEFETIRCSFVVGVDDESRGEAVAAVLVLEQDANWDPAGVIAGARAALSSYKVPRRWFVSDERQLPFLPTGKINRRQLRQLIAGSALTEVTPTS